MPLYDITEALPLGLGIAGTSSSSATWTNSNIVFDCAIGGIPMLMCPTDQTPYDRFTYDQERPQIDLSGNPGEQTLSAWWLRSQSSFHMGAGQEFFEPADDEIAQLRFQDSYGVDVFSTPGEVNLLPLTENVEGGTGRTLVLGYDDAGTGLFLFANGTTVKRHDGTTGTGASWGGAGTVLSMCDDGTNAYIADSTGIYSMPLASGAGSLAWNTGSARVAVGFVKQRLVAGIGPSVYELVGGAPPTLPTALYTHPNSSWTWVGFAEGPNCIYAAGYAGSKGAVFKFALDTTDGSMPTLTAGSVVAELPTGETVRSIFSYLGTYVAIGTNKGIRIALTNDNGDLSYGPLTVETTNPVLCFTGQDRFVFAGVEDELDGDSGLIRIDLGAEVSPLRYAYAADMVAGVSGTVDAVTILGNTGRLVVGNGNAYLQSATELMSTGWLLTSQIRYGTLEPKMFKKVNIRAEITGTATVGVSEVNEVGTVNPITTLGTTFSQYEDVGLTDTADRFSLGLKFTLTRESDPTVGPTFRGYQLKALPVSAGGEQLQIPIKVFDFMKDREGHGFGFSGYGHALFQSLKTLEASGNTYQFQDLRTDETVEVKIDRIRFMQNSPAHGSSYFGGVAQLELRTL